MYLPKHLKLNSASANSAFLRLAFVRQMLAKFNRHDKSKTQRNEEAPRDNDGNTATATETKRQSYSNRLPQPTPLLSISFCHKKPKFQVEGIRVRARERERERERREVQESAVTAFFKTEDHPYVRCPSQHE